VKTNDDITVTIIGNIAAVNGDNETISKNSIAANKKNIVCDKPELLEPASANILSLIKRQGSLFSDLNGSAYVKNEGE
jgi:hypothetical protein